MAKEFQPSLPTPQGSSVLNTRSPWGDTPHPRAELVHPSAGLAPGKGLGRRAAKDPMQLHIQDGDQVIEAADGDVVSAAEADQVVALNSVGGQALSGLAESGAATLSMPTSVATTATAASTATAFSVPAAVANDTINAGYGADTIDVGIGTDRANLDNGNDVFVVNSTYLSDAAADTVDGGIGYDGVVLQGTGLNFNLALARFGVGNLTGFEHVEMNGGGNALSLTAADVLELTLAPNPALSTLVINGDATNTVAATGFGSAVGAGVVVSVDVNGDSSMSGSEQFTTDANGQITADLGAGTQTYHVYNNASYGTLVVDSDILRTIV